MIAWSRMTLLSGSDVWFEPIAIERSRVCGITMAVQGRTQGSKECRVPHSFISQDPHLCIAKDQEPLKVPSPVFKPHIRLTRVF